MSNWRSWAVCLVYACPTEMKKIIVSVLHLLHLSVESVELYLKLTSQRSTHFYPCHFCFSGGVLFQWHRQAFPDLFHHIPIRTETYIQNYERERESWQAFKTYQSAAGSFLGHIRLQIFQQLTTLKHLTSLRQLNAVIRTCSAGTLLSLPPNCFPSSNTHSRCNTALKPYRTGSVKHIWAFKPKRC